MITMEGLDMVFYLWFGRPVVGNHRERLWPKLEGQPQRVCMLQGGGTPIHSVQAFSTGGFDPPSTPKLGGVVSFTLT